MNDLYLAAAALMFMAQMIMIISLWRSRADWIEAHDELACDLSDAMETAEDATAKAEWLERYVTQIHPPLPAKARRLRAQAGRN